MVLLAPALPPADLQRLEAGEILVWVEDSESTSRRASASGVVNAPPDVVYAVMSDFNRLSSIYPLLLKSEVRHKTADRVLTYFVLDYPWPLRDRWVETMTVLRPQDRSFDWKSVAGTVDRYDGACQFSPWAGNRTLIRFETVMDPGLPFLSGWFMRFIQGIALPMVIEGPKKYFQSWNDPDSLRRP